MSKKVTDFRKGVKKALDKTPASTRSAKAPTKTAKAAAPVAAPVAVAPVAPKPAPIAVVQPAPKPVAVAPAAPKQPADRREAAKRAWITIRANRAAAAGAAKPQPVSVQ